MKKYTPKAVAEEVFKDARQREHIRGLSYQKKRQLLREEIKEQNRRLAGMAKQGGEKSSVDFARFQAEGYRGLYGGLDRRAIQHKRGLSKEEALLDHMGVDELAMNLAKDRLAENLLRERGPDEKVSQLHFQAGRVIRQSLTVFPEELPLEDSL